MEHIQEVIDWLKHTLKVAEGNLGHFEKCDMPQQANISAGQASALQDVLVKLEKLSEMIRS